MGGCLLAACAGGDTAAVRAWLAENANVQWGKERDERGLGPLHCAAREGHADIVGLVARAKGVNLDEKLGQNGATALYLACERGHENVARVLVALHADLEATTLQGYTALFAACANGHSKIVELLVESGACVQEYANDMSPLHIASAKGFVDVVRFLVSLGECDVDGTGPVQQASALSVAVLHGHVAVAQELLSAKCNPDLPLHDGSTPFFLACQKSNVPMMELLAKYRCNLATPRFDHITPLHIACYQGHTQVVRWLLTQGRWEAQWNGVAVPPPIVIAAKRQHSHIVHDLVQAGEDYFSLIPLRIAPDTDMGRLVGVYRALLSGEKHWLQDDVSFEHVSRLPWQVVVKGCQGVREAVRDIRRQVFTFLCACLPSSTAACRGLPAELRQQIGLCVFEGCYGDGWLRSRQPHSGAS